MFTALLGPHVRKFLKKCNKELCLRLQKKIKELEKNPFPLEVKTVKGLKGKIAFRVRVGDHRIKYIIYQDKKELLIFDIDKRSKVYK